jgi:oxaloacetate decarboxylase alpha subunit
MVKKMDEKKAVSKAKPKIRITDTTLRDAHQSLWATRMRTDDILAIAEEVDNVGYYSLECWGGATFDVCLRFLRENPWERLRQIKSVAKKTPLQMLLRGQNGLGYKHYPDDILERLIALACENGMDIFRIFDALNDSRNLEKATRSVKKYGGHAQGTISYTYSPVHTVQKFVELAKEQVSMGVDTICIKDRHPDTGSGNGTDLRLDEEREGSDPSSFSHDQWHGGCNVYVGCQGGRRCD